MEAGQGYGLDDDAENELEEMDLLRAAASDDDDDVEMFGMAATEGGARRNSKDSVISAYTSKDERIHEYEGFTPMEQLARGIRRLKPVFYLLGVFAFISLVAQLSFRETPKIAAKIEHPSSSPKTLAHPENPSTVSEDTTPKQIQPGAALAPRAVLSVDHERFRAVSQVVLGATRVSSEMLVRFTLEEVEKSRSERTCAEPERANLTVQAWPQGDNAEFVLTHASMEHAGCIVSEDTGKFVWHYYEAKLEGLQPGQTYEYEIGQVSAPNHAKPSSPDTTSLAFSASFAALPENVDEAVVLTVGDTGEKGRDAVISQLVQGVMNASLFIHVGDMSYASNSGTCYSLTSQANPTCRFDCPRTNPKCEGRHRAKDRHFRAWVSFFRGFQPLSSRIPLVTTMGNHDNDLPWYFKFRPPTRARDELVDARFRSPRVTERLELFRGQFKGQPAQEQQALLNELLAEPEFFSVDVGPIHVVMIKSEDNGIDAYERATKSSKDSLSSDDAVRFDEHFGKSSTQYRWLLEDLGEVNRLRTPWVVVFTHRPPVHTSRHHPSCGVGGDWFLCRYRELYVPLFQQHGVNLVLNGHSHHYSRTAPMRMLNEGSKPLKLGSTVVKGAPRDDPIYVIVGTGGFELSDGWTSNPDWMAFRSADKYGFGTFSVQSPTKAQWSFTASRDTKLLDSAILQQTTPSTKKVRSLPNPLDARLLRLDTTEFRAISQVVLSLGATSLDIVVDFTVEEPVGKQRDAHCTAPKANFVVAFGKPGQREPSRVPAKHVGCIVSQGTGKYAGHYYVAVLRSADDGSSVQYTIGQADAPYDAPVQPVTGTFRSVPTSVASRWDGMTILALGDTGSGGRAITLKALAERVRKGDVGAIIHVGDQSYASAHGECHDDFDRRECQFDCGRNENCMGRLRQEEGRFEEWQEFMALLEPTTRNVPILTTMGNHDNDLQWLFKFRPAPVLPNMHGFKQNELSPASQQGLHELLSADFAAKSSVNKAAAANEILKEPYFYSIDVGPYHIISLQTETNAVGAHERSTAKGPLTAAEAARFDRTLGASSPQFKWLAWDLAAVDRSRTPWVVVFTHRPAFHTSVHHQSCDVGGDWFKCAFRDLYMPVFEAARVDLFVSGHSHHYMRTNAVRLDTAAGAVVRAAADQFPTYIIVGTGGATLDKGFTSTPDWIASRSDEHFGFASLSIPTPGALKWDFWPADAPSTPLDSVTLRRG